MTAPTKTRTALFSAGLGNNVLTAGAANVSSAWINLSATFESSIDIILTNGATGPTVAAQVQVVVANDWNGGAPTQPTNYGGALVGGVTNTEVDQFSVVIPIGYEAVQLVAGSNTVQNVTIAADISSVSGIA